MGQEQLYNQIIEQKEKLNQLINEYWTSYSSFDTWYFWFNMVTVIIPLVILYFYIDKKKLFEICFFGYTAHMLWANVDNILSENNILVHPHTLTHLLPFGVTVTAVLFPVTFMLLYQHCTNRDKNFYMYAAVASLLFAYGFGGISYAVELLKMHKGMNFTYLFFIDIAVVFVSYWVTKLFCKFKRSHFK
ncbi:hypothetical protein [Alteribacillus sp. YIM 98480]|uniref:hypothetical protein n=1 Tax=Alteribacillus sp. YIM 98480 TaxID=2606599 RepID=UPI00131C3989|nr:hypothetical protein [Alteribacillus sp. YIM 98480]